MPRDPICYIMGAGECHEPPPAPVKGDFLIAADGGYSHLKKHHLTPNLVVGDFDSMPEITGINEAVYIIEATGIIEGTGTTVDTLVLPREKDDTDMRAAINAGWERGYRVFYIYGGTGGRLDHTLANIQCIAELARRSGRGVLVDRDALITAVCDSEIHFPESARGTVSVFAHTETCTGVCETGLKYALKNAMLSNTNPLGISNEFIGKAAAVSVKSGILLVFYPKTI